MKFLGIRYFDSSEFDSPDAPGSGVQMDLEFVGICDSIRHELGIPLVVDSGFRTLKHNTEVGGEVDSAHMEGKAADFKAISSRTRFLIVSLAIKYGINRIGIGNTFVHLDNSKLNDPRVLWLYNNDSKTRR